MAAERLASGFAKAIAVRLRNSVFHAKRESAACCQPKELSRSRRMAAKALAFDYTDAGARRPELSALALRSRRSAAERTGAGTIDRETDSFEDDAGRPTFSLTWKDNALKHEKGE